MNWVNSLALIFGIIGVVMGTVGLKSLRSKEHPQAEISWKQPPLSVWRYETLTMIAITLHTLGLICLTVFVILSLMRNDLLNLSSNTNRSLLFAAIAAFAILFTTYSSGVAIAFHFIQPWIAPISYGISNDGLFYGGSLITWKSYSHYEIGPNNGLISLYSSDSPPLRTWVIQPPAESFSSVLGIIEKNLSSMPRMDNILSWQRSPLMFVLEMAVLVILALLPAIWGWIQNQSWSWIYAFIAFYLLQSSGIRLITLFDGRGHASDTKSVAEGTR